MRLSVDAIANWSCEVVGVAAGSAYLTEVEDESGESEATVSESEEGSSSDGEASEDAKLAPEERPLELRIERVKQEDRRSEEESSPTDDRIGRKSVKIWAIRNTSRKLIE